MKYLVIQSFVGEGTWWGGDEDLQLLYDDVLIPSFARYCKKYKYRHVVYRDQYDLIDLVNIKSQSNRGNLYHQYLSALKHQDDNVDYIVFPDADYYVTKNARAFPPTNCISGKIYTKAEIKKWHKGRDPETFTTLYGGIQIMKREVAINLAEYIKKRLMDYILYDTPITLMPLEGTIGEWIGKYNIKPESLSPYYNTILDDVVDRKWTKKDSEVGFWHFVGINKSEKTAYVLDHLDGLK